MRPTRLAVPLCLACALVLAVPQARAQSQAATEAEVRELITVTKADQQLRQMMGPITAQIMGSIDTRVSGLTPELRAELTAIMTKVMTDNTAVFIEAFVPIYQKYLTEEEVTAVTAFMRTKVGQAFIEKNPKIAVESMQAGAQVGQVLGRMAAEAAVKKLREKGYNL